MPAGLLITRYDHLHTIRTLRVQKPLSSFADTGASFQPQHRRDTDAVPVRDFVFLANLAFIDSALHPLPDDAVNHALGTL